MPLSANTLLYFNTHIYAFITILVVLKKSSPTKNDILIVMIVIQIINLLSYLLV